MAPGVKTERIENVSRKCEAVAVFLINDSHEIERRDRKNLVPPFKRSLRICVSRLFLDFYPHFISSTKMMQHHENAIKQKNSQVTPKVLRFSFYSRVFLCPQHVS